MRTLALEASALGIFSELGDSFFGISDGLIALVPNYQTAKRGVTS